MKGETDTLAVAADTSGLDVGTYQGTITISDPRAANNPLTIPVTLVIQSATRKQLQAWGDNASGQIGNGATTDAKAPVALDFYPTGVAAGYFHTLAYLDGGVLWSWGNNSKGQLGDGTTTNRSVPTRVLTTDGLPLGGVTSIAGGYYHSLAVSGGQVFAWGDNSKNQLGDGTTTASKYPKAISGLTNIVAVAAGHYHNLALTAAGELWGWGENAKGQLGDGSTTRRKTPVFIMSGVKAVAGGGYFTLILKADDTLWACGDNSKGQLGDGSNTQRISPVRVLANSSTPLSPVAAIAAGAYHSLAVKNDDTVWAWGDNGKGQLGDGTTTGRKYPVPAAAIAAATAVAAGDSHSLALEAAGTVKSWGNNRDGQLGDGTTTNRKSPVAVSGLKDVAALCSGGLHTLASRRVVSAPAKTLFFQEDWRALETVKVGKAWPALQVWVLKNNAIDGSDNTTRISLAAAPATVGTLAGTLTRTVSAGVAIFDDLSFDTRASLTLQATALDAAAALSPPVSVLVPTLAFGVQPFSPQIQGFTGPTFTVEILFNGLRDLTDNATEVTVGPNAADQSPLSGTLTRTARNGVATFDDIACLGGGIIYVRATASDPGIASIVSNYVSIKSSFSSTYRYPASNATGIPLRSPISAVFNAPVDLASLTSQTLFVKGPDGLVVGGSYSISADRLTASFTPDGHYAQGTTYTATLTNGVRSTTGLFLPYGSTWTFTTESAGWGPPALLQSESYYSISDPAVSASPDGNAFALWVSGFGLRSSLYSMQRGWSPMSISSGSTSHYSPQVAMDADNNALAAYIAYDMPDNIIHANTHLQALVKWTPAIHLGQFSGGATLVGPSLAMNRAGEAVVAWTNHNSSGRYVVMANRKTAQGTWSGPVTISNTSASGSLTEALQAACNEAGAAAVIWNQPVSSYTSAVYVNLFDPVTGWGGPTALWSNAPPSASPQIGIDGNGNVLAVWSSGTTIKYTYYIKGQGWGLPGEVYTNPNSISTLKMAMAPGGSAVLIWLEYNTFWQYWDLQACHYENGAWSPSNALFSPFEKSKSQPQLVVDAGGNAVVVYKSALDQSYPYSIFAKRYLKDSGWVGMPDGMTSNSSAADPRVSMDDHGNAFVLWKETVTTPTSSSTQVYSRRYSSGQ